MGQLFEAFLGNFVWIIVVIGFIVSALNKARKANPDAPRGGMPSFGGGTDARGAATGRRPIDMERPGQTSRGPRPAMDSRRPSERPAAVRSDRMPQAAPERGSERPARTDPRAGEGVWGGEGAGLSAQSADAAPHGRPAFAPAAGAVNASGGEFTAEAARQGVIWAEVFGPPRARRPHGRGRGIR